MSEPDPFLAAIVENPADLALRHVYADWLEEQGDVRAPFLRTMLALGQLREGDPGYLGLTNDKERLRGDVDVEWQRQLGYYTAADHDARVDSAEFCWAFKCPQQWQDLRPTEVGAVRYCTQCQMQVHYCETQAELAEHVKLRHCVAMPPPEGQEDITFDLGIVDFSPRSEAPGEDQGDEIRWVRGYRIP